jgi:hypothetical protein
MEFLRLISSRKTGLFFSVKLQFDPDTWSSLANSFYPKSCHIDGFEAVIMVLGLYSGSSDRAA